MSSKVLCTLGLIFFLSFPCIAAECHSKADCSYNGNCTLGHCVCISAWTGEYCEILHVISGHRNLGYQGVVNGTLSSSWGGAPLLADDGTYHMIVSEMINSAGLTPWGCNSHIIQATSPDPLKSPFVRKRVLWGVFSHEPRCTRAPAGEFVCYFSYNPKYPSPPCAGTNGETNTNCHCNNGGEKPTYMSYTKDLEGEWSEPVLVVGGKMLPDLNVSPFIFKNGSFHGLYRNNRGSNIHIVTATNWKEPSTYKLHTADLPDGMFLPEDPFLWRDNDGIFHSLHHNYPYPSGPHAFSVDGWTWHTAPGSMAYNRYANFTDSQPIASGCRERPSLIFSKNGAIPIALVNGFSPNPSDIGKVPSGSCRYVKVDYSFTLVQPLNQK